MSDTQGKKKCGYIAIVGRPNVGKSTLLNHLLEQKISITSRKPQTTRYNVVGIKTVDDSQLIFVDTPGIHLGQDKAINRMMNRSANSALQGVDVIVFVVDKNHWTDDDAAVKEQILAAEIPTVVVVNKMDQIDNKNELLPVMAKLQEHLPAAEIVPASALQNKNLDELVKLLRDKLPESDFFYPEDQVTDRSMRFMAAEIIREKLTRQLGAEIPYQCAVEIEEFIESENLLTISALVLTEREGQKRILIGDKGKRMKTIAQQAREDMENMFDSKVMLNVWVKVKSGWSDSERALKSLGFDSDS